MEMKINGNSGHNATSKGLGIRRAQHTHANANRRWQPLLVNGTRQQKGDTNTAEVEKRRRAYLKQRRHGSCGGSASTSASALLVVEQLHHTGKFGRRRGALFPLHGCPELRAGMNRND